MTKVHDSSTKSNLLYHNLKKETSHDPIAAAHFSKLFKKYTPFQIQHILDDMLFMMEGRRSTSEVYTAIHNLKGYLLQLHAIAHNWDIEIKNSPSQIIDRLQGESPIYLHRILKELNRLIIPWFEMFAVEPIPMNALLDLTETYLMIHAEKEGWNLHKYALTTA